MSTHYCAAAVAFPLTLTDVFECTLSCIVGHCLYHLPSNHRNVSLCLHSRRPAAVLSARRLPTAAIFPVIPPSRPTPAPDVGVSKTSTLLLSRCCWRPRCCPRMLVYQNRPRSRCHPVVIDPGSGSFQKSILALLKKPSLFSESNESYKLSSVGLSCVWWVGSKKYIWFLRHCHWCTKRRGCWHGCRRWSMNRSGGWHGYLPYTVPVRQFSGLYFTRWAMKYFGMFLRMIF